MPNDGECFRISCCEIYVNLQEAGFAVPLNIVAECDKFSRRGERERERERESTDRKADPLVCQPVCNQFRLLVNECEHVS